MADILNAAYQAEVAFRKRDFVSDDNTINGIYRLASFLTSENSKFGLMFSGICGNGKTTLLLAFQNMLNLLTESGYLNGVGISIVDAKDVAGYAKDIQKFELLKRKEMLAIEDMGREPVEVFEYGNVLNPVIDLLEYRYNAQLFTIITTNLVPKDIRERYGVRLADRFNEMFEKIIFWNETYRK